MALFKHLPKAQYITDCTILIPGDNNQIEDRFQFKLECKRHDHPEIKGMISGDPTVLDLQKDSDEINAIIRKTVAGWSDMPAADGGTVPFSEENLEEALKIVCYRAAFWKVFLDQLKSPEEPVVKNSKR